MEGQLLPDEPKRLAIGMWGGAKDLAAWSGNQSRTFDFFDLKGVLEGLLQGLQLQTWNIVRLAIIQPFILAKPLVFMWEKS